MGNDEKPLSKSEQARRLGYRPFYTSIDTPRPDPNAPLRPMAEKPKPAGDVVDGLRRAVEKVQEAERPVKASLDRKPSEVAQKPPRQAGPKKMGRPKIEEQRPWEKLGMNKRTWYRKGKPTERV